MNPGASQNFGKGPSQNGRWVAPLFLQRGQGGHFWDSDANALGHIIPGQADPDKITTLALQLQAGTVFSLLHPLSVAEPITESAPDGGRRPVITRECVWRLEG